MDVNSFFSEPVNTPSSIPTPDLNANFGNPFEGIAPAPPSSISTENSSNANFEKRLDQAFSRKPSFQTRTAPVMFDWDAVQADRYVQSDYYKELGVDPFGDNESRYGYRQTWGNTMSQAFSGSLSLAASTFVEGWKGWGNMMDAIVNWDASKLVGSPEELEELNAAQKNVMNKYAIFATPDSEESVFNRQFVGNMVQQSGFALGTIAQFATEELLTMGAATFLKPITGASALYKLMNAGYKTGDFINDVRKGNNLAHNTNIMSKLYKGLETVGKNIPGGELFSLPSKIDDAFKGAAIAAKGGAKTALPLAAEITGLTLSTLRRTMAEANMAFTEARMEAAGTYGDLKEQLYQKELKDKGVVTEEKREKIDQIAQKAAMENFSVNAGVISVMNRLQFDNLFKTFGAGKRTLSLMAENGQKDILKVTGKKSADNLKTTKLYNKGKLGTIGLAKEIATDFGGRTAAWQVTKSLHRNLFKWEVSEGLQELIQEGSNIAIKDYYLDLYNGDATSWKESISEGASEQKNIQGVKTFLMGAMTGRVLSPFNFMIGKGMERLNTTSAQREGFKMDQEETVNTINEFFANPAEFKRDWIANTRIQNKVSKDMEQALINRDKYAFENAKDSGFTHAILAAKKLNMLESMVDTLKEYGDGFNETEFKEAFGVDFTDENRQSVKEYMRNIGTSVEKFSKRFDKLKEQFSDVIRPEMYADEDRKVAMFAKAAMDEAVGWLATIDHKQEKSLERAFSILDKVYEIPTASKSAALAFRTMGDRNAVVDEIKILREEIKGMKSGTTTDAKEKGVIARKEAELESIEKFRDLLDKFSDDDAENDTMAKDMMEALKNYINLKNIEMDSETKITSKDLNDLYGRLSDYMRLKEDQRRYADTLAMLSNPLIFVKTFNRINVGLKTLQNKQKLEALSNALKVAKKDKEKTKEKTIKSTDDVKDVEVLEDNEDAEIIIDERFAPDDSADFKDESLTDEDLNKFDEKEKDDISDEEAENLKEADDEKKDAADDMEMDVELSDKEIDGDGKIVDIKDPTSEVKVEGKIIVDDLPWEIEELNASKNGVVTSTKLGEYELKIGTRLRKTNTDLIFTIEGFSSTIVQGSENGKPVTFFNSELKARLDDNTYYIIKEDPEPKTKVVEQPITVINNGMENPRDQIEATDNQPTDLKREIVEDSKEEGFDEFSPKRKRISSVAIATRSKNFDGTVNDTYENLLSQPWFNEGAEVTLEVDTELKEWAEFDNYETRSTTNRKLSDFFDEKGNIYTDMIDDFPIVVYTVYKGKKIKLGSINRMKYVTAKYQGAKNHGQTINIVEKIINPDGTWTDNLSIQTEKLRKLRFELLEAYNKDHKHVHKTSIKSKGNGIISLHEDNERKLLSDSVAPNSVLAIVKENQLWENKDTKVDLSNAYGDNDFNNKNGWVLVIVNTPTGKKVPVYTSVNKLDNKTIDTIIDGYKAFWDLANHGTKDPDSESFKIVSAFYKAMNNELIPGEKVSFKIFKNYVDTYLTFLSGREYDPLQDGQAQLNFTDKGEFSVWATDTKEKSKDLQYFKNPYQLMKNEARVRELMSMLYYNVRMAEGDKPGINDSKKITLVEKDETGQYVTTSNKTYNEHVFGLLRTRIKGRPTQEDINDNWIYFDNPVLNINEDPIIDSRPKVVQKKEPVVEDVKLKDVNNESIDLESRRKKALANIINETRKTVGGEETSYWISDEPSQYPGTNIGGFTKEEVENKINEKYNAESVDVKSVDKLDKTKIIESLLRELYSNKGRQLSEFTPEEQALINDSSISVERRQQISDEVNNVQPSNVSITPPDLKSVIVDLKSLSLDEVKNVAKQLRQKAVDARENEKNGKTVLGGSAMIQLDYEAVKDYVTALENQSSPEKKKSKLDLLAEAEALGNTTLNKEENSNLPVFQISETFQDVFISPTDKVIFGHPTIGKSYLKEQGDNRFITLDDDYANEVNAFIDANRGNKTRQEYKGSKPKEYNDFMINLFDRLKIQAEKEGKILFVSNTNILKERMSDFDKVITIPKEEFKKRFDARGSTYGFEDWKSDIDATIAKVSKNKVINTTGYLADLFKTSNVSRNNIETLSEIISADDSIKKTNCK